MKPTTQKTDQEQTAYRLLRRYHKRMRVALARFEVVWEESEAAESVSPPKTSYAELLEEVELCAKAVSCQLSHLDTIRNPTPSPTK